MVGWERGKLWAASSTGLLVFFDGFPSAVLLCMASWEFLHVGVWMDGWTDRVGEYPVVPTGPPIQRVLLARTSSISS